MPHDRDHGPEGLGADLPHLTRRRLLVTGLEGDPASGYRATGRLGVLV